MDETTIIAGIGGIVIYFFGHSRGWALKEIFCLAVLWGLLTGLH